MNLLMRFMNGIVYTFMNDPASFDPIYWREVHWGAAEWCEGFLLGTRFKEDAWSMLWVGKPTLATPFLALARMTASRSRTRRATPKTGWRRWSPPWSRFTLSGRGVGPANRRSWRPMIFVSGSPARH
jgi:hypothetical protein